MATADNFREKRSTFKLTKKRKHPDDELPLELSKKCKYSSVSLSDLPDEILLHIFSKLPFDTIINASLVCLRWNELAKDSILWGNIFIDETTPLKSFYKWISIASRLKHFTAINRNDVDLILEHVSKRCKKLKTIKLISCQGTPSTLTVHSRHLCNLLTRCCNLHHIKFDNLTLASCKFFKLMMKYPTREICYEGPMTLKQFVTYLEYAKDYQFEDSAQLITENRRFKLGDIINLFRERPHGNSARITAALWTALWRDRNLQNSNFAHKLAAELDHL